MSSITSLAMLAISELNIIHRDDISSIPLVTFDGAVGTTFTFKAINDPVMGGKSTGSWTSAASYGIFDGDVVDVPRLKAPGFIKAFADGKFADVSTLSTGSIELEVRSSTSNYTGFRVAFAAGTFSGAYSCSGGGGIPFSRGCFKAKFAVPAGKDFSKVTIPFTSFSDKWSAATGEQTATCAKDKDVCPTPAKLKTVQRFELWAEGVNGVANLEVRSISAVPASSTTRNAMVEDVVGVRVAVSPPVLHNKCSGPLQFPLRYGISGRTEPTVPVAVDANETLADAVCCDDRALPFAEPRFLFEAPDIILYSKINAAGVTTFYDSVCGVPLFKTPINRTLAEFKADTNEHGWPSFRSAEVVSEHVKTDISTGFVTSSCGTHLGSYLPDAKGARWCMDLSCIAGNPV